MIHGIEAILIGSENAQKLAEFYREVVGLKQTMEFEMGENGESKGFAFEMEGCSIYINDHSEVHARSHEPQRVIFNLKVDDIEEEVARLNGAGVKKIADIYHVEDYGMIATFEDVDGNYFQFVQTHPNEKHN
jgi:predicted enzyme related to lactoylglutathione lyase